MKKFTPSPAARTDWTSTRKSGILPAIMRTIHPATPIALAALLATLTLTLTLTHAAPNNPHIVDATTLTGKVMCGDQGWFNAAGDGAGRGYHHWARSGNRQPCPETITFDLWPDLSELPEEERFPTQFKNADGSAAEVFSSFLEPTVHRHFQWMREYGIHGVFLQRFINTLDHPPHKLHNDTVLAHVRSGAEKTDASSP